MPDTPNTDSVNWLQHARDWRRRWRIRARLGPELAEARRAFAPSAPASTPPSATPPAATPATSNEIERRLTRAFAQYGGELETLRRWARFRNEPLFFPERGMYDWIEAQFLYLLVRERRPETVVEISPNYGYSTGILLLAMNANGTGQLLSFDLDARFHRHALGNFAGVGLDASRQRFFAGDVRRRLEHVPGQMDLLFMDSDHSHDFASWYLGALLPRLARGGLLHVHDVLKYGVPPHPGDEGEGRRLWEYVRDRQVPAARYLYVSEWVREQPVREPALRTVSRYPFPGSSTGTNGVEQSASFWMLQD